MARFITNAGGATHSVTESEYVRLLSVAGFRAATEEEIVVWHDAQGLPVPATTLSPTQTLGGIPVAQPVLPTGGETNPLAGSPGDITTTSSPQAPAQQQQQQSVRADSSSTGDETSSKPSTPKPASDATGKPARSSRKSRPRNGA